MKKHFIVLGVIVALTIPLAAFAATSDAPAAQGIRSFCGIDPAKLTDKQKIDLFNQWKKLMELRKETINQMVSNGSITKEQGVKAIQHIDAMIQYRKDNGYQGCGTNNSHGGRGRGLHNGGGCNGGGCNGGGCGGNLHQPTSK